MKLTTEQLVVENCPFEANIVIFDRKKGEPSQAIWFLNCLERKHDPEERATILKDDTTFGIESFRETYEKHGYFRTETVSQALELLKEVESINEERILREFNKILKKLSDNKTLLTEMEKKILLKIFRHPYKFLSSIEQLYLLSLKEKRDVLENLSFRISPITTASTIQNMQLSIKETLAIIFFTNLNWYKKEIAPYLFLIISSPLRRYSGKELLKNTNTTFWLKIKNHYETFSRFYREKLFAVANFGTPTAFDVISFSFVPEFINTSDFKLLIKRYRKISVSKDLS